MGIWKVLINRWSGIWIFWKINIYDRGDEVLKRPLCLAVCIYIAFLVGMRWVSEKDVPDLQAQNTVTILCQLDEIRGMGEKKNFVVSSVVADGKKVCNKLRVFPNDSLKWDQTMEIGNILELTGIFNHRNQREIQGSSMKFPITKAREFQESFIAENFL